MRYGIIGKLSNTDIRQLKKKKKLKERQPSFKKQKNQKLDSVLPENMQWLR